MASHYAQTYPSYQEDISRSSSALLHSHEFGGALVLSQFGTDGNHDPMQTSPNISPYPDSPSTTTSPSSLVASNDGQDTPSSPPRLPDSPDLLHSSYNPPRKQRKEKQRIDLAPDQPPTTQGRPRARVFVACVQWCASSLYRCLALPFSFPPAGDARSAVTVRSPSASTALSAKGMKSAPTIIYQSVVGPTESRERVPAAQGRRMMDNLRGGGAVVPRRSSKPPVAAPMAFGLRA